MTRRSIEEVHRDADLGHLVVLVMVILHGASGLLIGAVLAITGPTTPSFVLLDRLPGWPAIYGLSHVAVSGLVLAGVVRRRLHGNLNIAGLTLMALGYGAVAITVLRTWTLWADGDHTASEPLLTAAPVCGLLAIQCGFLALLLAVMRRRGAGSAAGS